MTDTEALLVPVVLDALTVGRTFDGTLRRQRMNYTSALTFGSPEPLPFTPSASAGDPSTWGVYLMWTLPPGLRNATQVSAHSPDLDFPLVPNRWLVLRRLTEGSAVSTTTWVVESDFLDLHEGTNSFIDPASTSLSDGDVTNIGRRVPLTAASPWSETATRPPFLRAIGPGDPTFAAFQPSNENVFSLHDDLEGVDSATVDYLVVGWYAGGHGDPLGVGPGGWTPDAFQSVLDGLRWDDGHGNLTGTDASPPEPRTRTASRSVYHGALLGVQWDRTGPPPPSPRETARPRLALGHTAADALTGFLQSAGVDPAATTLLEALLADEVDALGAPDGDQLLRRRLRDSWFGASAGGVTWSIEDAPNPAGAEPAPMQTPTPAQVAAVATWLTERNRAQAQLDDQRRQLASMQRDLYEMWWKGQYAVAQSIDPFGLPAQDFVDAADPQLPGTLASQVKVLADTIAQAQALLPAPTPDAPGRAPADYARDNSLPDSRRLVAGLTARFYAPHDPVVLVAGLAHDMVMDPTTTLRCRYPDEVMTATAMQHGAGRSTTAVSQLTLPVLPLRGAPDEVSALLGEFELLVGVATEDPERFGERLATAPTVATPTALSGAGPGDVIVGKVPDIELRRWEQPWQPLYLEWKVRWYPAPYAAADGSRQWRFDGAEYALDDHVVEAADAEAFFFSGRALLTPGFAHTVRQAVEAFVRDHGSEADLAHLEQQVEAITEWDFLTQTLDGLNTQLTWRNPRAAPVPEPAMLSLLGGQHRDAPNSLQETPPPHHLAPPPSTFDGMRAGQLALQLLAVVDRFGRVLDLDAPTLASTAVCAELAPGHSLDPAVQAQFAPRVLQGARLRFELVPDQGPPQVASQAPWCGFVVPHHLERALVVYDAVGQLLGELAPAAAPDQQLRWDPAVAGVVPTIEALGQDHPELGKVVSGLQGAGIAGFDDALTAIDESLWAIDPLGGHEDEYLSALVGRPLAVVRAELRLELDGAPVGDPSWPYSFDEDPRTLLPGLGFAITLGTPEDREDGLVGYFTGAYDALRVVRPINPADAEPDPGGYVVTASPDDLTVSFDAGSVARVTLLVDPRGQVQAHTGLLPTTVLTLPHEALTQALKAMRITFRAGPLLTDDPDAVPLMPAPRTTPRSWGWVDPTQADDPARLPLPFRVVDDRARFGSHVAAAREGVVAIDPGKDPDGTTD